MGDAPRTFPVADLTGTSMLALEPAPTVDPERLAQQLKAISDAIAPVLDGESADGRLSLREIEIALTIGAEGGVWFVAKGSAEASITLRFGR